MNKKKNTEMFMSILVEIRDELKEQNRTLLTKVVKSVRSNYIDILGLSVSAILGLLIGYWLAGHV